MLPPCYRCFARLASRALSKIRGSFHRPRATLKSLLDLQLNDYKAGLVAFNTNISVQALLVVTAVLVIIRRSDSSNLFGNSIPLSWLHVFIPILLIYLFMAHGYISHRVIASRMLGLQIAEGLQKAERLPHQSEYRPYFATPAPSMGGLWRLLIRLTTMYRVSSTPTHLIFRFFSLSF